MALLSNRLTTEQYEANFSDIHPPFETKDAAMVEANRCLFCYDAPCMKSCPTSIDVPKFIKQITTDNVKGSAHTILVSNIMGAGCSKVCPVEKLCEGACVYNLMDEDPIPIAKLQRYSTEMAMQHKWQLFTRKESNGKKVAVIGAGPAGLSCAHVLSREGVDVTIYEKEKQGGGLMTYGIAAYKVTPQFCKDEVDYILSIGGITIKYEQELGKNIQLSDLQNSYDAVYLAIGVGLARKLEIPGEQLDGVVDAIQFIHEIRDIGFGKVAVGDKVAVIGMGMTAIDAATQAKRLGASEVTMLYRRTQEEMPCTEVESPITTGETFSLNVDMVIKAAGQMPYQELVSSKKLENNGGKLKVSNNQTNLKGVFAGGDCVNGGKEVVDAVQAGKDGAFEILKFLSV